MNDQNTINLDSEVKKVEQENEGGTEEDTDKNFSLFELEKMISEGKKPPGIKVYDDLPKEGVKPSESQMKKPKKPWEE